MTIANRSSERVGRLASLRAIGPGLCLAVAAAAIAFALRALPGLALLSPMILAIVIGMGFHNLVGTPAIARPGLALAMRRVLRTGIVLLGFQLTLSQLVAVGAQSLLIIVAALVATFFVTRWLGRLIGVDRGLAELIAAGTAICGASAVIAANTVTGAKDEDVAYAVASVTIFGSVAMLLYPLLAQPLALEPEIYGLWAGASIHEVAQVIAASFQVGQSAGEAGIIAKLSRVLMLAPLIIALGFARSRRTSRAGKDGPATPTPWFVFGFLAVVVLNSAIEVPQAAREAMAVVTLFLLSVGLAAMGLETDFGKMRARGLKPLALGAASSLFIGAFSLMLIKLTI